MGNADPILQLLKDLAYSPVRLPRESIHPLQIVEKQGNELTILGELSDLFGGTTAPPAVGPDRQAAFINGKRTRELEIHVGLSLLGGIIGAMTGSKVKLDAAYKTASSLTFEFEDVKVNDVNLLGLNRFLSGANVDSSVGQGIMKALEDDRLYVITSIIKSQTFKTEAIQSNGSSAAVDVPAVKEIVGATVQIQHDGDSDCQVTYSGTTPLVFGFQAARMEFERGIFKGLKQVKPEEVALRGLQSTKIQRQSGRGALRRGATKFELLTIEGPFANLIEKPRRVRKATAMAKPSSRRR